MKRSPIALAVALVLLVGWLGYLATQAWQYRTPPVIVSRAQLLTAELDVLATLDADPADPKRPAATAEVTEVLFPTGAAEPKGRVSIGNLRAALGFIGPGTYVLPLVRRGDQFVVAGLPLDPGAPPRGADPRVYPATEAVRRQFADIRAGKP